ncbi:MAG TPA: CBS domain-containing protein [Acidimicrobiales bacterium]|jgi:CBS domain-containing protein|nr:CBS domain-containing protein [Acidimicrobiales bacterium]
MPPDIVHLSALIGSPLLDRRGDKIGRVDDLIVRAAASDHPLISGIVGNIGGRELFVPIDSIFEMRPSRVQLQGEMLNLGRFERRSGELLLRRDLSGRHIINLVGARLIRANEIELACIDGQWRVVAVDPSIRGAIRRALPRRLARRIVPGKIVDWESVQPFVAHVPTARMRIPYRKLARLRPAQIADLVEAASHDEGEEIIEAVGMNRELEADVFEELDPEHQREFLHSRSDAEAARLLATMEPDDAADLITDLDQERRLPILEAVPEPKQQKIRALLNYNPETAGGLMSPNFLSLSRDTTVAEALEEVRKSQVAPEALSVIYLYGDDDRLCGTVSVVKLLKSSASARLRDVADPDPITLRADADLHEIGRKMSDFDLAATPVVDSDHKMIGVITVDDVLELLLPAGRRRELGIASDD